MLTYINNVVSSITFWISEQKLFLFIHVSYQHFSNNFSARQIKFGWNKKFCNKNWCYQIEFMIFFLLFLFLFSLSFSFSIHSRMKVMIRDKTSTISLFFFLFHSVHVQHECFVYSTCFKVNRLFRKREGNQLTWLWMKFYYFDFIWISMDNMKQENLNKSSIDFALSQSFSRRQMVIHWENIQFI